MQKSNMKYMIFSLIGLAYANKITCPVINCDTTIGNFNCFEHSSTTPVESIDTYLCPYDQVCNLEFGKYAWITAKRQLELSSGGSSGGTKSDSQVYKRYTSKACEMSENFN